MNRFALSSESSQPIRKEYEPIRLGLEIRSLFLGFTDGLPPFSGGMLNTHTEAI